MKKIVVAITIFLLIISSVSAREGRIFVINSYDDIYAWSSKIISAVKSTVGDKAELKIMNMNSKCKYNEEEKLKTALEIKKAIDDWNPDVIIAADDNASKYVIVPYYKNTSKPVIFCGINWDASEYGFPCSNVTGMLEINLIDKCIDNLRKAAKGNRIGILGMDNETDRKEGRFCSKKIGMKLDEVYTNSYEEWQKEYINIQKRVDILIVQPIPEWETLNKDEAKKFIMDNTVIPTASTLEFAADYSLLTYARLPEEHGAWAATAALKIIEGKKISSIKMTESRQSKLIVNMTLANKLNYTLPLPILKTAHIINSEKIIIKSTNSQNDFIPSSAQEKRLNN